MGFESMSFKDNSQKWGLSLLLQAAWKLSSIDWTSIKGRVYIQQGEETALLYLFYCFLWFLHGRKGIKYSLTVAGREQLPAFLPTTQDTIPQTTVHYGTSDPRRKLLSCIINCTAWLYHLSRMLPTHWFDIILQRRKEVSSCHTQAFCLLHIHFHFVAGLKRATKHSEVQHYCTWPLSSFHPRIQPHKWSATVKMLFQNDSCWTSAEYHWSDHHLQIHSHLPAPKSHWVTMVPSHWVKNEEYGHDPTAQRSDPRYEQDRSSASALLLPYLYKPSVSEANTSARYGTNLT